MDILISWSKRQSHEVAKALKKWLQKALPGVAPWVSSQDIDKGKVWFTELQGFLGKAKACIVCVTPENLQSPWLYYEAGAIATKQDSVLVLPYLVGVTPALISGTPLAQFQYTIAEKGDTLRLLHSLNKAIYPTQHNESILDGNFQSKWASLKAALDRVAAIESDPDRFVALNSRGRKKTRPRKLDENDILSILEHKLAGNRQHLDKETFDCEALDKELGLPNGSAKTYLPAAAKRWGYIVLRQGANFIALAKGKSFYPSAGRQRVSPLFGH